MNNYMNNYSGSGIIPIITYNKKVYFILFSSGKNLISDAGGTLEDNNSISKTAIRELFEESCGLINITEEDLQTKSIFIDIINPDKNHIFYKKIYRAYFILIKNIDLSDLMNYYNNLKKFKPYDRNPFAETYGIHLIKLDWIHYYKNTIYMNTHTDKLKLLNMRLSIIMSTIIDIYGDFDNFYDKIIKKIQKIKLKQKKINVNTYSYKDNTSIRVNNIITYFS